MNANLLIGLATMLLSLTACAGAPISHFSVQVHEENGDPIEGAEVQGGFSNLMRDYVPGPDVKAVTDKEGKAAISGPAYFSVYVDATKDDYYKSGMKMPVNQEQDQSVSILLRQKRNPIPLYVKHFVGYLPKIKTKIAFDFSKGDWVSPYGKGAKKDIYFYYDGFSNSFANYEGELKISFPNEADGLIDLEYKNGQYSELKLPYMAAESGYKKTKLLINKRKGKGTSAYYEKNLNLKNNFGYFLRIRSEVDHDKNIIQGNYVKIAGDFDFDPRSEGKGAAYIEMTYYLNPSINDRNLEFDPRQNLFKNLKHLEKVGQP